MWVQLGEAVTPYKEDVILHPYNRVTVWDWTKTGTHHHPGIQVGDFLPYLGKGNDKVAALVLSTGMDGVLEVPESTLSYMRENHPDVRVYVENTREAARVYNDLADQGVRLCGLFHLTC